MERICSYIRSGENEQLEKELKNNPSLSRVKTEQGISFLMYALYCRNPSAVKTLRKYIEELNLFEAAGLGEEAIVKQHLDKNPEWVNSFSADGFTALGLAAFFNNMEVVRILLNKGANPNIAANNSFKVAPLHSACASGNVEIAKLLLDAGAYVNSRQLEDVTPLHSAAHNGNIDLTTLLLKNGADVTAVTTTGQTPLSMGMEKNHNDIVNLLKKNNKT